MQFVISSSWNKVIFWFAILFGIFSILTSGLGFIPSLQLRALHLLFGMSLMFLAFDYRGKKREDNLVHLWDIIFIILLIVTCIYIIVNTSRIYHTMGLFDDADVILGTVMILLSVECSRRVYGWVVPGILGAAFLYLLIAPYLPGVWGIPYRPVTDYLAELYATPNGLYGLMTDLSATLLAGFVLFGGFLLYTGAGEYFIKVANILTGRFRGGPGKVAVVASAFFGSISGSAVANVAMTGNYTIPLMKKLGYKPEFAGAVESVASSGGMLAPPIMGAGAFVMAEILGISYLKIIVYALIPCLLYYTSVFAGVHFEALRSKLSGLPKEDIPPVKTLAKPGQVFPFLIPIIALLYFLGTGWSITYAIFISIIVLIAVFLIFNIPAKGFRSTMSSLGEAASKGAISLAKLAPLSACMSMVIYIFGLSGITVKFSHLIMEIGQSNIILALFPAAVIPLLLGMSVPPVAAYVISAAIVAPALIQLGVVDIVAHFFVFYISCLAPFTPPICAACFVAAAIADAPWLKIGWIAIRLGFVAYLVSFMIVINPALLGIGTPGEVLQAVVMGLLGTVVMVSGFLGYFASRLNIFARLLLVASGFLMIWPETSTDIVGLVVAVATLTIATLISRRKVKKSAYA